MQTGRLDSYTEYTVSVYFLQYALRQNINKRYDYILFQFVFHYTTAADAIKNGPSPGKSRSGPGRIRRQRGSEVLYRHTYIVYGYISYLITFVRSVSLYIIWSLNGSPPTASSMIIY